MGDDPGAERTVAGLPVGERGMVGAIARLVKRGYELGRYRKTAAPYDSTAARSCVVCRGVPALGDLVHHAPEGGVVHPACLAEEFERLAEDIHQLGSS